VPSSRRQNLAAAPIRSATHELPRLADEKSIRDAALFLDMDLSILGASPEAFDAYEQAVRREYAWVEEPMWRAGRGAVLKSFLARQYIFHTDAFRRRFEPQARQNLARSLETLEGPVES
jgi:predicted metal-dependent HD superfamily phosphohydrolase